MSEPDSAPGVAPKRDILAGHRERIVRQMAITGAIFLTPFAVNHLIEGRVALGIAVLAVIAVLGLDAIAAWKKKPTPIPFAILPLPMAACIAVSLVQQGFLGALWAYPAVLFCYFVLSRRAANIGGICMGLLTAVITYFYVPDGTELAVRFAVTLGLTIVVINITLTIIGQLQTELMDQALTDPLTGAFNRRQMALSLTEAIERNRRSGAPASILVIDIDHFKKVNDDFGHHVGDVVLKGLVALIRSRTRKLDRLFRMGGEEFALLLPDARLGAAMKQAEALRKMVSEAPLLEQRPVTVSIGVAEYMDGQTQDAWVQAADDALYQAKAQGRNTVVCGSPDSESIPGLGESARRYSRAG